MSCGALLENAPEWAEVILCPPNKRPHEVDVFVIQNSVTYGAQWIEELALAPVIRHIRDPWYAGSAALRRWILNNAEMLIFSSPIQAEDIGRRYPHDRPTEIIPVPVNLDAVRAAALPKDERSGNVFVGRVDIFKGAPTVIDWAIRNRQPLTLVGSTRYLNFGGLPSYIQFAGKVPYSDMPELLGGHLRYIAMPEWPEAFGRSVAEAWAAGCDLVLQGRIGAQWWIENEPDRLGFHGPIDEFWSAVKGVLR
jgi:glycosyltransferase involved in cell wall biosynthesis